MGLGASLRSRRFVSLFSTVFFPNALGIGLVHGGQFMAAFACCLPPFFGIAVDRFVSSSRSSTLLPPLAIYIDGIVDVGVLVNIRFLPETVLWVAGLVTLSRSTSSASSVSRRDVEPTVGSLGLACYENEASSSARCDMRATTRMYINSIVKKRKMIHGKIAVLPCTN